MFIVKSFNHHRNDFSYVMACEHCSHEETCNSGYDDANYHNNVIPNKFCKSCGKNRMGGKKP